MAEELRNMGTDALINAYADAVQAYFEASEKKSIKDQEVSRRFDYKNSLIEELEGRSAEDFAGLKRRLSDSRPAVRLWVSYSLEELFPGEVKETYQDLTRYLNSIGINANFALARMNGENIFELRQGSEQ